MDKAKLSLPPDEPSERLIDIVTVALIVLIALWLILPVPLALMLWSCG
jgi:uncharacterized RDD family membrane protein YckC